MRPTAPACAKGLPAFRRGLMVRGERRRNLRGRAADQDRHLALQVQPRKIVEILFRNAQAIADKYQRRFDLGRQVDARAEDHIFSQGQRLRLAIANQSGARLRLHQLARYELHRLVKPLRPRRLKACRLQLADGVSFRPLQPRASRVTTFHVVGGQHLDVVPPGFPVE